MTSESKCQSRVALGELTSIISGLRGILAWWERRAEMEGLGTYLRHLEYLRHVNLCPTSSSTKGKALSYPELHKATVSP